MLDNRKPEELPELTNKMVKVRGSSQLQGGDFVTYNLYLTWCVCVCVEHSACGVP